MSAVENFAILTFPLHILGLRSECLLVNVEVEG